MISRCPDNRSIQAMSSPLQVVEPVYPLLAAQDEADTSQVLEMLRVALPSLTLSNLQLTVLLKSWQGRTYGQMADSTSYDPDYLKDVGHKLWKKLSEALEQPVSKHNVCVVLRQRFQSLRDAGPSSPPAPSPAKSSPSARRLQLVDTAQPICNWGEVPKSSIFLGRSHELAQVKQWMVEDRHHLIGLFGLGGIGKTALAVQCVEHVREQFDYIIWRSLRDQPDCDSFMTDLLQGLIDPDSTELPETPTAKISLLLHKLNQHRCLLVIDDWFSVLRGKTQAGLHQENHDYYGLLLRLVSEGRHQSCVLITSREKPVGLAFKDNQALPVRALHLGGVNVQAGREILQAFGLDDTNDHLDQLFECYSGNPYALRVAAKTIIDLFSGRISKFLEQEQLIYGDIRRLLEQQFNRLSEFEEHLVHCLARLSDWVSLSDIEQTLTSTQHNQSLLETIESLDHRSFIEKQDAQFRLQRLLQRYAVAL